MPQRPPAARSYIDPRLACALYPLGQYVVLPLYFGRIAVQGRSHIPRSGPLILAPTHRSRWDALMVPYAAGRLAAGRDLRFMVTADEMQGIQGWAIRRLGGFPVNQQHPDSGSLRYSIELLCQGCALVIFPEGGIERSGAVAPLMSGLGRVALHAQARLPQSSVRVLPMGIRYARAYPRWGCNATVRIGKPLEASHYHRGSLKQGARQLTQDLSAALEALAAAQVPATSPSPAASSSD